MAYWAIQCQQKKVWPLPVCVINGVAHVLAKVLWAASFPLLFSSLL